MEFDEFCACKEAGHAKKVAAKIRHSPAREAEGDSEILRVPNFCRFKIARVLRSRFVAGLAVVRQVANSENGHRNRERERERAKSLRNDETLKLVYLHGCAFQDAVAILSLYIAP